MRSVPYHSAFVNASDPLYVNIVFRNIHGQEVKTEYVNLNDLDLFDFYNYISNVDLPTLPKCKNSNDCKIIFMSKEVPDVIRPAKKWFETKKGREIQPDSSLDLYIIYRLGSRKPSRKRTLKRTRTIRRSTIRRTPSINSRS